MPVTSLPVPAVVGQAMWGLSGCLATSGTAPSPTGALTYSSSLPDGGGHPEYSWACHAMMQKARWMVVEEG